MYYLQSRYYDPEVGRFLNADAYTSTGQGILSCNMFVYCANNPINAIDPTGESFLLLAGVIGATLGAVIGGCIAASQGENLFAGAAAGAVGGVLCGLGLGAASSILLAGSLTATSAVISGASALATAIGSGGMSAGVAFVQGNLTAATTYTGVSLYAGGEAARSAAETFSRSSGGIMIQDTWIGKTAAFLESVAPNLSQQIWRKASEFFCQHVSGEVNVFISNSGYDPNQSIFWKYELPALINSNYFVEIIMEFFE